MSVAADVTWLEADAPGPHLTLLGRHLAVGVRGVAPADRVRAWVSGVYAGRDGWTRDFGGEQFALGRAFYTHLEQDKLREYFADAKASNERVERAAPGLQALMRELVARFTGGRVIARADFCGAGVHVFPHDEKVASAGGVVHFDTEGLPARHLAAGRRALSLVLMLQPPEAGGGLTLWDLRYQGEDGVDDEVLERAASVSVRSTGGDLVVFDSLTLHQIQAFSGRLDRISATVHAAEIDRGLWETWF